MTFDITTPESWQFLYHLAFLMTVALYAFLWVDSIQAERRRRITSRCVSLALVGLVLGTVSVSGLIRGDLACADLPWWLRWVETRCY